LDTRIPEKAVADGTSNFTDLKNLAATSSATLNGRDFNFGRSTPQIEIPAFPGETPGSPFGARIPESAVADGTMGLNQLDIPQGTIPGIPASGQAYNIP
jgi:hypothetical protein